MIRGIAAALVMTVLAFSARAACAQTPQSLAYLNELTSAVERILAENLRAFTPNLTREEKAIVDQIQIRVDRGNWNMFATGALLNRQTRQRLIVLPVGFVVASDYMDRAILEMSLLDDQRLVPYMRHISESLRKNKDAAALGRPAPVPEFKGYCEFTENTAAKCRDLRLNSQYLKQLYAIKASGLALVLGHEIAHHVKGHLEADWRLTTLETESEADRFAVSLALRSGANLMLAMGSFLMLGILGVDLPVTQIESEHPHPLCRAVAAMRAGIRDAERNPRFRQFLHDNNAEETLETIKDQLYEIKKNEAACN